MKYSSKSLTHVGKVRSANEDSLGEAQTPNGNLFVVCDGMGGHVGGATASSIAIKSIIEFFQRDVYDNVIQAIDHSLSFANEQIYASALSNPELKGMGTTAVVLLIRGEECFIGHVGDSRIYLRSDDKLNRITKDHSFVQTLVDSGVIDDEDAEKHPNKNQILQALGIASSVKGTICQAPILPKKGDMFLLCSDGLNGMVTDRDLEKIMQEDNIAVTAENLITAALNGGGHDNITASLVLIEESTHSVSRFVDFNPKPKMSDMSSTQQFGGISNVPNKKKSKLPYIIGGGVVLLGASVAVIMMMGKEVISKKADGCLKINELQSGIGCSSVQKNDSIDVKSGSFDIPCDDNITTIKIVNYRILDIDVKTIDDNSEVIDTENSQKEKQKEPEEKTEKLSLKEMTEDQIKKLKIGSEINETNGVFIVHNHKVTIKSKKIDDIVILHKVAKNQGLGSIVSLYKSRNKKLSESVIAIYNQTHGTLTEIEKDNIVNKEHDLNVGSTLEIPLKGN